MIIERVESRFQPTADGKCSVAEGGMVATAFPEATQAGVEMLNLGGNAVDAACAAALALGVCEPQGSGIGGQGMAILQVRGRTIAVDGSSRVPSLAHMDRFRNGNRRVGHRATTIPSTLALLGYLNFRYGRLEWDAVVEPATRIARYGYRITELQHSLQARELDHFLSVPGQAGARYFLKGGDKPYEKGDLFVQPDLADLLRYLAQHGPRAFYMGKVAERIDEDMQAHDGFLRKEDLALIPWPIERKPLKRRYRDVSISTIPPPAAGLTLLLVMMMLNNLPSRFLRKGSPESFHFVAETFRKALLQWKQRPYDPNTYPTLSDTRTMSRDFAHELSKSIMQTIDPTLPLIEPPEPEPDTTHLSVMDEEGTAIGITQSIELAYGAKAACDGLGFLYNNYMYALDIKDPSHPYYLRPNAVPWSLVAPAIVFYKKRPWLVMGSTGSARIYSTVSQVLMRMIDGRLSMAEAIEKPRMHCSIGGRISLEADRFDPTVVSYLEEMGYKVIRREPFSFYHGAVHAVMRCHAQEGFQGVAEPRRDGTAAGPP